MCSELTPRAPVPDNRIPQLMQPWLVQNSLLCCVHMITSLLVSSITMVGLPRLPVIFVMKSIFWWPIATQQLWSTPRKHQQRGEDDKPIPPKGDGSRAALAIGASVPFADKDNGEKFKIIYSSLSSSFRQTFNNQQNLHQFHFHLKKASLYATPPWQSCPCSRC